MVVPKGDDFLPDYSTKQINEMYKKENNPKAKVRLLAAVLRKENETLQDISRKIKHPFTTIGDWLRRMHEEGISRRYDIEKTGRPKRLTNQELKKLESVLSKKPTEQGLPFVVWTTKLVRFFIERDFKISYKLRQVRNILHKMKMSLQKPRPSHRKANKELQEAFKKSSGKRFNPTLNLDMRSCYWTKASSR